jgi:hypothetical protein
MQFGFIAKHRGIWPAGWLCEALGVSRGAFYAWLTRPRSQRSRSDEELGVKVRASFFASDRTYGARRVWRDLLTEGMSCGLHRIERLMRLQALKAGPRRRSKCAQSQLRSVCSTQMDCGLHICLDDRRLALRGRGHRSLLPARCRLVDECGDDGTARHRCLGDGDLATGQTRCATASLRSRQPIHQRAGPAAHGRSRRRLLDELIGQRFPSAAMSPCFNKSSPSFFRASNLFGIQWWEQWSRFG